MCLFLVISPGTRFLGEDSPEMGTYKTGSVWSLCRG
jgi:hypothetical protein